MNFDFTNDEKRLLRDIKQIVQVFLENNRVQQYESTVFENNLRELLILLSETQYFNLSMGNHTSADGSPILMAVMESLAAAVPSLFPHIQVSSGLFGRALNTWGNKNQREIYLSPLAQGNLIGTIALREGHSAMEHDVLETSAKRDGNDWVINGVKKSVINGPLADCIAVVGYLEDQVALFLLEKGTEGLIIETPAETACINELTNTRIEMHNCRISPEQVIVKAEKNNILNELWSWENQLMIGISLGLFRSTFDNVRDFAKTYRFKDKPLIAYQEIGFKLSEMFTKFQTSQLLAYRALWMANTGHKESDQLMWCAKTFCSEAAEKAVMEAANTIGNCNYVPQNTDSDLHGSLKYTQISGIPNVMARTKIGNAVLGIKNR